MSQSGKIIWTDLTIPNAEEIRDFYSAITGWQPSPVDIGEGYSDYNMNLPGTETAVAGICHARGINVNLPPQWLIYIQVDDVAASAQKCVELGGKIVDGPRLMGESSFCVIKDPAGAVAALYSSV